MAGVWIVRDRILFRLAAGTSNAGGARHDAAQHYRGQVLEASDVNALGEGGEGQPEDSPLSCSSSQDVRCHVDWGDLQSTGHRCGRWLVTVGGFNMYWRSAENHSARRMDAPSFVVVAAKIHAERNICTDVSATGDIIAQLEAMQKNWTKNHEHVLERGGMPRLQRLQQ
jgi:hypothetical protein